MMFNKTDLTDKTRGRSAHRIYYGVYLRVFGIGLLCYLAVVCAIFGFINFLYPGFFDDHSGYLGGAMGGWASMPLIAQERAMRALRKADLLDEEELIIERTAGNSDDGPTLEVPSSRWGNRAIIGGCLLLCAMLGGVIFISADSRWFQGVCLVAAIVMGGIAVTIWKNRDAPEVRLDDRGVFLSSSGLDPKLVPWRKIARARFQRVASAPKILPRIGLFSFLNPDNSDIISLENSAGKVLLTFNSHKFGRSRATRARFVAELKRRLTAATPSAMEENDED